jgi:hypothetical protein
MVAANRCGQITLPLNAWPGVDAAIIATDNTLV